MEGRVSTVMGRELMAAERLAKDGSWLRFHRSASVISSCSSTLERPRISCCSSAFVVVEVEMELNNCPVA